VIGTLGETTIMKAVVFISLLLLVISCKKNSKESCPEQTYNIECAEGYPDLEFPGYLTGTNRYSIQSYCLEDAIKAAQDMSYDFGGSFKHCQVVR